MAPEQNPIRVAKRVVHRRVGEIVTRPSATPAMLSSLRTSLSRTGTRVHRHLRAEARALRTDAWLAQAGLAFLIAYAITYAVGALGGG